MLNNLKFFNPLTPVARKMSWLHCNILETQAVFWGEYFMVNIKTNINSSSNILTFMIYSEVLLDSIIDHKNIFQGELQI